MAAQLKRGQRIAVIGTHRQWSFRGEQFLVPKNARSNKLSGPTRIRFGLML